MGTASRGPSGGSSRLVRAKDASNPTIRTAAARTAIRRPAMVIDVLQRAASHVDGVDREMPCFARVASFGDSSVTYEVKYFARDFMQRDRIDADIRKAVWYALRRNDISIPFPVRAFHSRQWRPSSNRKARSRVSCASIIHFIIR